jgi:20S proteasome alpha/beta subunit|tara:strand:+ start:325 stop:549 length:225 start_codon:yes stop_codon:yes gene_type:complete
MAAMDCLIGFTGKDFVMMAADRNAARSIMVYSQDEDKIRELDSHKLLAVGGALASFPALAFAPAEGCGEERLRR